MSISDKERLDIIRLIRSENVGTRTFYQMVKLFGGAGAALERAEKMSGAIGRGRPIKICQIEAAEKEISDSGKLGAKIITYKDEDYPFLLSMIPDAPPVLSVLGDVNLLKKDMVAIVGARNASANGCRMAHKIAAEAGKAGFAVISGLASGIDGAAHKGALVTGTIGVVAGGVDFIYPKENENLYKEMAERGVIISEHPPGTVPRAENFPRRNRIISGLSLATIVVEAAEKSGSLITARFALEQGREVMAIPGSPMDPRSSGPNKLIKQGAILVQDASDIIEQLVEIRSRGIRGQLLEDGVEEIIENLESDEYTPPDEQEVLNAMDEIIGHISATPVHIDELIAASNLPAGVVIAVLIELELMGRLERHTGGRVALFSEDMLATLKS